MKFFVKFINNHKFLFFWSGWFLIYLFLGMCLCFYFSDKIFTLDLFFGTDSKRVFYDFITITNSSHCRIKVHPLMLILLGPISFLIKGFFVDWGMTLLVFQSAIGASFITLAYKLMHLINIKKSIAISLIFILGLSFSTIIFSAVPETYIFSGFCFLAFLYYVIALISKGSTTLTRQNYLLLTFFGMLSIGIQLGNYIPYLLCLALLLLKIHKGKPADFLKSYTIIVLGSLGLTFVLLMMQHLAYRNAPFFYKSLYYACFNKSKFEDFLYVDCSFSLHKVLTHIQQVFFLPIMSSDLKLEMIDKLDKKVPLISFCELSVYSKVILSAFYSCILFLYIKFFIKKSTNIYPLCILSVALVFYVFSLFIYSTSEAFIYSAQVLYLIVLIAGIVINELSEKFKKIIEYGLFAFLAFEIINNLYYFSKTVRIVFSFFDWEYFSPVTLFLKDFLVVSIIVTAIICVDKIFRFRKNLSADNKLLVFIGIYLYLIISFCALVSINVWKGI